MKVTIKYDQGVKKEEIVILEVPEKELEKMMEIDYQNRLAEAHHDESVEMRAPAQIIEEWNRQEYNAWRRHHRYLCKLPIVINKDNECFAEINQLDLLADDSEEKERHKQVEYATTCQKIRRVLKPEQAEMIIAICIDGMSVKEYAAKIGDKPNNVTQRFKRVKSILKEILSES